VTADFVKGDGWQVMARQKFTFEKRQREIARQQKQKDKVARRAEAKRSKDDTEPGAESGDPGAGDTNDTIASPEETLDRGNITP
jgi:hypothetical protein